MNSYIIYDKNTGQVLREIQAPKHIMEMNLLREEEFIEHEPVGSNDYIVQDGTVKELPPAPTSMHEFDWEKSLWVLPLETAKTKWWDRVKSERAKANYSGFLYNEMVFDSNVNSQQQIQGAVLIAQTAVNADEMFEETWTLSDSTTVVLNALDIIAVGKALGTHVSCCYKAGRIAREQINNATTIDEVFAVDYQAIFNTL